MISRDVQGLPTHLRLPGKAGQTCYSGTAEQPGLRGFCHPSQRDFSGVASRVNKRQRGVFAQKKRKKKLHVL